MSSTKPAQRFAVCVKNDGYPASLEVRKIYEVLRDPAAEGTSQVRVVDESGDDYLYPADFFLPVDVSDDLQQALRRAS